MSVGPKAIVKQVMSGDCVVLRGQPRGGPPPEKIVCLSNITAPRVGRRVVNAGEATIIQDEPFGWEAREFLRRRLIGKEVLFQTEHKAGREYGRLFLLEGGSQVDVAHELVSEGLVTVRRPNVPKLDDEALQKLCQLEEAAKAASKKIWLPDNAPERRNAVRDVVYNIDNPSAWFDCYKGKKIEAVVDHVRDGSTVRCILMVSNSDGSSRSGSAKYYHITILLTGLRCPFVSNEQEPFALEAKYFVECRLLQRDVHIVLEGLSGGTAASFVGSILHPKGNIALLLLSEGFAKCVDWSMGMLTAEKPSAYRSAEAEAKRKQLRVWKDYVAPPKATLGLDNGASTASDSNFGYVMEIVNADSFTVRFSGSAGDIVEKKLFLSSIRPPRADTPAKSGQQTRPLYDVPWLFEAREFLRKKLVGKRVRVEVDYVQPAADGYPEKTCCSIFLGDTNIAEALVSKGFASVLRHRQDDERRSRYYDQLLSAEQRATKKGFGPNGIFRVYCDFDNGWCAGFNNNQGSDEEDFDLNSGKTPSNMTGPNGDYSLNGFGQYIYLETSFPTENFATAILNLPTVTATGFSCLEFAFSMYGVTMGSLEVYVNGERYWEKLGNQGHDWILERLPINIIGPLSISFLAVKGSGHWSDIALDSIGFKDVPCDQTVPGSSQPSLPPGGIVTTTLPPTGPCAVNPCLNQGSCHNSGDQTFYCVCPIGFSGPTCEQRVPFSVCDINPCLNGGTCLPDLASQSFSCRCASGWSGQTCNQPVNPCESRPCNSGVCIALAGGQFNCICPPGTAGRFCELGVTTTSPVFTLPTLRTTTRPGVVVTVPGVQNPCRLRPCRNNGICSRPAGTGSTSVGNSFNCRCPEPFVGKAGKFGSKEPPSHKVNNLTGDVPKSRQFLPFLSKNGVRHDALVEFVASSSRVRVYIPRETCLLTLLLAGVDRQRGPRQGQAGDATSAASSAETDKLGQEALRFTRDRCLQREVQVIIEAIDRFGNFIGWLFFMDENSHNWQNLSVSLVEEGLAKCHPTADRSSYYNELHQAEESARQQRKNIWHNYQEPPPQSAEDEAGQADIQVIHDAKRVTNPLMPCAVTELQHNLEFYAQLVDKGPQLEELMKHLNQELSSKPMAGHIQPRAGELCAAQFADSRWYRARIEQIFDLNNIAVFYVDYGNRERVNVSRLAPLPAGAAFRVEPLAQHLALAGVEVPDDPDNLLDACVRLNELITGINLPDADVGSESMHMLTIQDPVVGQMPAPVKGDAAGSSTAGANSEGEAKAEPAGSDQLVTSIRMEYGGKDSARRVTLIVSKGGQTVNVGQTLIYEGLAIVPDQLAKNRRLAALVGPLTEAQDWARRSHRGLWHQGDFRPDDAPEWGTGK